MESEPILFRYFYAIPERITRYRIYGQQIGVLELYQNINVVRQWLNKIRLYLGVMLSLILAVLIVSASSALHLAALKPIQQMVDTIMDPNAIVEGRLVKRIEGGTTYELQGLANSFNRMVEDIGLAYEQERRLKGQLQVLHDAAMALSADLSLEIVLQQIMGRARELCGARYAALLLADASGGLKEFLTAGITPEQQAAIGPLPQGLGLLRAVLQEGEMLSLRDIREDPRSVGFPSGHPPLTAIIGFSELLHKGLLGELNPKQAEYVGDILNSGRHLLSLINDILDLSKVEAEEMEMEMAEVSLKSLLEMGLMMVRQRALKHGIALSLSLEEELDTLVADERKVKQVLFNLLSNAVKFTPDGGQVGVEARRQGDWVTVTVWDTGIGISFQDQRQLFQPFQQIDSSLERRYEGTGLGLALTKKLVELHGGKIWVESTPEEGSRFIFTLPLQGREAGFPSLPNQDVILSYASFCRHLERLVNMAKRRGRELAVIQLKLGEAGGNAGELKDSLGAVVAAIKGRMRSYDVMGRGKGEPALFLALPDTPLPLAQEVGLRCRALLEEEGIRAEIQVAGYPKDGETVEGLIRAIVG